jgi:hypothetical protein
MVFVTCNTCHYSGRCSAEPAQHRESFFACFRGDRSPACCDYRGNYERGVDGVLSSPSPRPSRQAGFSIVQRRSSC